MKLSAVVSAALLAFAASAAEAQEKGRPGSRDRDIPAAAIPPAGMCRIWLEDVPVSQQPAPTDCAAAVRNRPAKGRVIFGDDYVRKGRAGDTSKRVPIKGFTPSRKP
jgi:hypothetical protein